MGEEAQFTSLCPCSGCVKGGGEGSRYFHLWEEDSVALASQL